ncbi:MAG: Hpt domain-containing protein [Cyclobacteriaceae bacterium]
MCVIDLSYLRKISNNNQTFIKEMIESFLECAPEYLAELETFTKQEDWLNVQMTAHKLKPSATYLGLPLLLELILSVERAVKNNPDQERISEIVAQMHQHCSEAYPKLKEVIDLEKYD